MNRATSMIILTCMILLSMSGITRADNVRPAYLGIENIKESRFRITWKNPLKEGRQLPIAPVLPEPPLTTSEPSTREPPTAEISPMTYKIP